MRKLFAHLPAALAGFMLSSVLLRATPPLTPPFTEAPPIGDDTSAEFLIVINNGGGYTVSQDVTQGPFDGSDDTLVAVVNLSSTTVYSLPLSSPYDIFGFDGDGLCTYDPSIPCGPTGYEGPGVTYSSISADQTSGIVNFTNGLAPGQSTYFGLENALVTKCNPLLGVPLLKQGGASAPWGTNTYDSQPRWTFTANGVITNTISRWGCALTSCAMLINYYATNQNTGFSTTPDVLNAWLSANRGYDSAGGIDWYAISRFALSHGVLLYYHGRQNYRDDFTVQSYLCGNYPIILKVAHGNGHYVLATGETIINGTNTFLINDPGFNYLTLENYNFDYLGSRLFSSSQIPPNAMVLTAHSPVEMLVTDPSGNRTGYNPTNGQSYNEIPGSSYSSETIADDDDPTGTNQLPVTKVMDVPAPANGNYTLQVFGTGAGTYTLDFVGYDGNGNANTQGLAGSASVSSLAQYKVSYSSAVGATNQIVTTSNTVVQAAPEGSNDYLGGLVELCSAAGGSNVTAYQWLQYGQPIQDGGLTSGSDSPCLTLGGLTANGQYSIVITMGTTSVTSQVYSVSMIEPTSVPETHLTFNGLFYPPDIVAASNSGAFKLTTSTNGKFSATARFAANSETFSGKFDLTGHAAVTNMRPSGDVVLNLQLDTTPGLERVTGTLNNGVFDAGIYAYAQGKNPAAPGVGAARYTLAFPGGTNSTNEPPGWSTMTATMNSTGTFSLNANLADGSALSESLPSSTNGIYPLFSPLYGGKGLCIGWLSVTNDSPTGNLLWIKPSGLHGQKYYAGGFTLAPEVIGSIYEKESTDSNAFVLGDTTGTLVFAQGGLSTVLTNGVSLTRTKTVITGTNEAILNLTLSSGAVSGHFTLPGTKKKLSFDGVILQEQNTVVGSFLGTNQGGTVLIQ